MRRNKWTFRYCKNKNEKASIKDESYKTEVDGVYFVDGIVVVDFWHPAAPKSFEEVFVRCIKKAKEILI